MFFFLIINFFANKTCFFNIQTTYVIFNISKFALKNDLLIIVSSHIAPALYLHMSLQILKKHSIKELEAGIFKLERTAPKNFC